MVTGFQGVRVEEKQMPQQALVKDYMASQLITFKENDSISHAANTLIYKNISGAPVVDDDNNLVGIISEGDCLKQVIKGKYNNEPHLSGTVGDHMIKEVITLGPEVTIFDAALAFLEKKVRRFPIIENGKLIGQISQRDVMKALDERQR